MISTNITSCMSSIKLYEKHSKFKFTSIKTKKVKRSFSANFTILKNTNMLSYSASNVFWDTLYKVYIQAKFDMSTLR